ncbi:hypothetical protein MRS44_005557 [Fusarium solani]|uniref:uncharacterized protein n=1 Tax=Fusarium solani TaxID=169388 RepID=UPI0032C40157|nr:hypothetical protein MRS44_005557 [Fusarium solani]
MGGGESRKRSKYTDMACLGVNCKPSAVPSAVENHTYSPGMIAQHASKANLDQSEGSQPAGVSTLHGTRGLQQLAEHQARGFPGGIFAALETNLWLRYFAIYEEEIGLEYPFFRHYEAQTTAESIKEQQGRLRCQGNTFKTSQDT